MKSSEAWSQLVEIDECWRYVGFARMMFGYLVRQGRYNINRVACRPKEDITRDCAVDWGIMPHLAERLTGQRMHT